MAGKVAIEGVLKFIGKVAKNDEEVAKVSIFPGFCEGLIGLCGFSHIIILC